MSRLVEYARLANVKNRQAFLEAIRLIHFEDVDADTGILIHHAGDPIYCSPQVLRWFNCKCLEQFEEMVRARWDTPEYAVTRVMVNGNHQMPYRSTFYSRGNLDTLHMSIEGRTIPNTRPALRITLLKLVERYQMVPNLRGGAG